MSEDEGTPRSAGEWVKGRGKRKKSCGGADAGRSGLSKKGSALSMEKSKAWLKEKARLPPTKYHGMGAGSDLRADPLGAVRPSVSI